MKENLILRYFGILITIVSFILIIGSLYISFTEINYLELFSNNMDRSFIETVPVTQLVQMSPTEIYTPTFAPSTSEIIIPTIISTNSPNPIFPTSTATLLSFVNGCEAPNAWVKYTVKQGDTLFDLYKIFQLSSYSELQDANCMGSSTTIITGEILWVPDISP